MRLISENLLDFSPAINRGDVKIVRDYRLRYKRISDTLERYPEILQLVDRDLQTLSRAKTRRGRRPSFTSENLFLAVIVMQTEGLDYRETSLRIGESETLQNFCRLRKKKTIDFTLISRAFCAISDETWQAVNRVLAVNSAADGLITPADIRTDTTVTECNIHWPTDSSLLWDVYRVVARELSRAREIKPAACPWRFHPKKAKKLHLSVTRYARSTSKRRRRQVHRWMRSLIVRVEDILEKAGDFVNRAATSGNIDLSAIAAMLKKSLPVMRQVAEIARRREMDGERVPIDEKVFSIFEPHTELIMRGRRGKPIEFGHKILLSQSAEKFITDYLVLEKSCSDSELLSVVIDRHREIFGVHPEAVAGDMGFCPDAETYDALDEELDCLAVPRRTRDFGSEWMALWQQWRAGIEGTISCLKRAFRLSRCCFRGFKNYASGIGSAIFCHNLVVLANLEEP